MEIYELIEKLGKQGYSKKELSIVYFDAKINKKMKDSEITEEYLISNLCRAGDIKVKVDSKTIDEHMNKQLDFISLTHGIVFVHEIDKNKKKAWCINDKNRVVIIDYESLIPLLVKSDLYKEVMESPISRYITTDDRLSRKEIYYRLRMYGTTKAVMDRWNIIENPEYIEQKKKKKESIKVETEPEEISDNTNMIPKYICINGMFSQNQVNYIVKKVEEDLTLLETIGIIENPKYKDSSKNSKKLIKK